MASSGGATTENTDDGARPARRLPRAQRREQILVAATEAFAETGYASTSLTDVARAAGVTRMIVYTHFESKTELYQAVLDRMRDLLNQATGAPDYHAFSIAGLLAAAVAEPAGFRLLFHHTAREPEFRAQIDRVRERGAEIAYQYLGSAISDPAWGRWAAAIIPTFTIEAVIAWLDAGQPGDVQQAAKRIRQGIEGIVAPVR